MNSSDRMVQASHALRALQIFACLNKYRPTLVGSTPINIDLQETDLDIICEAYDLSEFEEQAKLVYGNRSNFSARRVMKYSLPSSLVGFFSHGFHIGIFAQAKSIEKQAAYVHMKVEERLLELSGEAARQGIRELKKKGLKTEPAFTAYFQLAGDPYQVLLDLERFDMDELRELISNQQKAADKPQPNP